MPRTNKHSIKHGMSGTRIYKIYRGLKARCIYPKTKGYKHYGGKGIKCEWNSFEEFYRDMKDGYKDNLTIERENNDGNYCKDNCKWVTWKEQGNNRSFNRILEFNGKKQTVSYWSKEIGVSQNSISKRINKYGWSIERALTTPTRKRKDNIINK